MRSRRSRRLSCAACVLSAAAWDLAEYRKPLNTGISTFTPTAPYQLETTGLRTGVSPTAPSARTSGKNKSRSAVRNLFADSDWNSNDRISGRIEKALDIRSSTLAGGGTLAVVSS